MTRYFAHVDSQGLCVSCGFSDAETPSVLGRPGVVELSQADYATIVATPTAVTIVDGVIAPYAPPFDLAAARSSAVRRVDRAAEEARLRFVTPGAAQMLEYQYTAAEARALIAAGSTPSPEDYPFLAAEQTALATAGETASLVDVADLVLTRANACAAALVTIKELRRAAKEAIAVAADQEAIQSATAISWPMPG